MYINNIKIQEEEERFNLVFSAILIFNRECVESFTRSSFGFSTWLQDAILDEEFL